MIDDEALRSIEKLHQLKTDGVITEADFEAAKQKLLQGQRPVRTAAAPSSTSLAENDWFAWAILPLQRYADFTGRSSRKEYWLFSLVHVALFVVSGIFAAITPALGIAILVLGLLGLFVPQLAVQVRRFHDQDNSGWFALFNLIPYLGVLIVLVFMCMDGTPGNNQYGPDPKQR